MGSTVKSKNRVAIPGLGSVKPLDKISSLKKQYLSDIVQIYKRDERSFVAAINFLGMGHFETQCLIRMRVDLVSLEVIVLFSEVLRSTRKGINLDSNYLTTHPLLEKKQNLGRLIIEASEKAPNIGYDFLGIDLEDIRSTCNTSAFDFYSLDQLAILACLVGAKVALPKIQELEDAG